MSNKNHHSLSILLLALLVAFLPQPCHSGITNQVSLFSKKQGDELLYLQSARNSGFSEYMVRRLERRIDRMERRIEKTTDRLLDLEEQALEADNASNLRRYDRLIKLLNRRIERMERRLNLYKDRLEKWRERAGVPANPEIDTVNENSDEEPEVAQPDPPLDLVPEALVPTVEMVPIEMPKVEPTRIVMPEEDDNSEPDTPSIIITIPGLEVPGLPEELGDQKPKPHPGHIKAFPEAYGYGAYAKGGRGGKVLLVTNLNDSGPGSFRAALKASGPRTVVFRTGGTIQLKSTIVITNPYLTIAGQTAPGDGITIKLSNNTPDITPLILKTHDVVIRHLRLRSGAPVVTKDAKDAGNNNMRIGSAESHRIIIDHCSMGWAIDQVMAISTEAKNITIQNSIISEGLEDNVHPKGPHSRGPLVTAGASRITFYRNLFAHNAYRNPLFNINDTTRANIEAQIVNNIVYNWGPKATQLQSTESDGVIKANVVSNYYKPGEDSHPKNREITIGGPGSNEVFAKGNIGPNRPNDSMEEWTVVGLSDWLPTADSSTAYRVMNPHQMPELPTSSAFTIYEDLPRNVGATRPGLDAVDKRIINDLKNGTGRIINDPSEVGGWPTLAKGTPPVDQDNDGMPDDWEQQNGFDPNDAEDRNGDKDGNGYTNLEEFLNG